MQFDTDTAAPPELRPVPEFLHVYRIGKDKLYDLLAEGVLEGVKVSSRTYITRASEERWLASLPRFVSRARRNHSAA